MEVGHLLGRDAFACLQEERDDALPFLRSKLDGEKAVLIQVVRCASSGI